MPMKDKPDDAPEKGEEPSSKGQKQYMKNFSVGSKSGKRVVSIAGMTRFKGDDGQMVIMRSGDVGPVPDHIVKALNAGKHKTFVPVPKEIPKVGDPVGPSTDED